MPANSAIIDRSYGVRVEAHDAAGTLTVSTYDDMTLFVLYLGSSTGWTSQLTVAEAHVLSGPSDLMAGQVFFYTP